MDIHAVVLVESGVPATMFLGDDLDGFPVLNVMAVTCLLEGACARDECELDLHRLSQRLKSFPSEKPTWRMCICDRPTAYLPRLGLVCVQRSRHIAGV